MICAVCPLNSFVMHLPYKGINLQPIGHRSDKATITIGICLACVLSLGKNRYVSNSFQFCFTKDEDKEPF